MEQLLEKLKEQVIVMDGLKVVPLSIIENEIRMLQEDKAKESLEAIQQDVRNILNNLEKDTKKLLNG